VEIRQAITAKIEQTLRTYLIFIVQFLSELLLSTVIIGQNHNLSLTYFREKAIPIPITTIGMRLPPNRIDGIWVAASKPVLGEVEGPQALGMAANTIVQLNTYSFLPKI
jgi:hypothetical protein